MGKSWLTSAASPQRHPVHPKTLCLVTVPLLPGSPRSVPVSITTDAGTSATLDFHYL
jgi:hypothetical protein